MKSKIFLIYGSSNSTTIYNLPDITSKEYDNIDDTKLSELRKSRKTIYYMIKFVLDKLGEKSDSLKISHDSKGVPFINNNYYISISHKKDTCFVSLSDNKIGVDVEFEEDNIDYDMIGHNIKSNEDNIGSYDFYGKYKINSNLALWSIKESYFKLSQSKSHFSEIDVNMLKKQIFDLNEKCRFNYFINNDFFFSYSYRKFNDKDLEIILFNDFNKLYFENK